MTDKTPTSINLRDDHAEWMDANSYNRSEFINKLIADYRESGGSTDEVVTRFQLRQLQMKHEQLLSRAEMVDDQMDKLEDSITSEEERAADKFAEIAEQMDGIPAEPSNPAVQTQAEKLDMDPESFADRLRTWRADDA